MLRKLLLLLLIGFAFTEVSAQEHLAATDVDCGNNTFEFIEVISPNAWDAYDVIRTGGPVGFDTLSAWGISQGATLASNPLQIQYSTIAGRWEMFSGGTVVFIHPTYTGLTTPSSGWIGTGVACAITDTWSIVSENGGVLPVDREEFSNIKIYPNPSTGFINISNLKENSRVVISNITGQVVKDVVVGVNDNRIDIQDLPQGFYFVELEGKKTIKLLKR